MKTFDSPSKILLLDFSKAFDIHQHFLHKRRQVMAYRLIFIFFGIIFATFSFYTFIKTPNWVYTILFGYGFAFKTCLSSISILFAGASLWVGCHLRTEIELVKDLQFHALQQMKSYFRKTRSPLPLIVNQALIIREHRLKYAFQEGIETIHSLCILTQHNLEMLNNSRGYSEKKKRKAKLEYLEILKNSLNHIFTQFEGHSFLENSKQIEHF